MTEEGVIASEEGDGAGRSTDEWRGTGGIGDVHLERWQWQQQNGFSGVAGRWCWRRQADMVLRLVRQGETVGLELET